MLQVNYGGQLDARGVDWTRRASEGARRLEARINNLPSYSRLDSRGAPFESVDLGILLEALEGLEALINETEANINASKLPTIMGDPTQLVQLFQNLISNSIKYRSASPPQVHVSAEDGNGEWVFSVANNGIGIDPQHHKRIFELFQRLHKQEDYPGDGIGLTLCGQNSRSAWGKKLAPNLNSEKDVRSFSRFLTSLSSSNEAQTKNVQPVELLLVEDNDDDIVYFGRFPSHQFVHSTLTGLENGEQCMAFLRKEPPFEIRAWLWCCWT